MAVTVRAGFVLLAGGMGSRMGSDVNKVYLELEGRNIIDYSLTTAAECELVTEIVVVIRPDDAEHITRLGLDRRESPPTRTTFGGTTRHESEYAGVAALRSQIDSGDLDVIAVHDGARPFMSRELLDRALRQAAERGSALPACSIDDTLYFVDTKTFADSANYVWVQTPQVFDATTLLAAHDAAAIAGFNGVDTAEVVQRFSGRPIETVPGDRKNVKVTYQRDLLTAEHTARQWGSGL